MHRLVRVCLAAAVTVTAVASTAGPASADHWWGRDRSGDVRQVAISPDPPPCGTVTESTAPRDATTDLVGLSVRHERSSVEVRAHFRDLTAWRDRYLTFDLQTDRRGYEISIARWRPGGIEASLLQAAPPPESFDECGDYGIVQLEVPCDLVMTRSPARDFVSVVVPRSCLRDPRWVRAGVRTSRTIGDRYRWDVWSHTPPDPVTFSGPFGPRVRPD